MSLPVYQGSFTAVEIDPVINTCHLYMLLWTDEILKQCHLISKEANKQGIKFAFYSGNRS